MDQGLRCESEATKIEINGNGNDGILTPRATPSPNTTSSSEPEKKRRKTWNPNSEYEIEKIIGYHRDETNNGHMTYFVKWKGWSKQYNSYEPIENLVNCNHMLMKFFEYGKASKKEIRDVETEIEEGLENYDVYKRLVNNRYSRDSLDEFSDSRLDISKLFKKNLNTFKTHLEKEYGYIVRCLIGMYNHRDPGMFKRGMDYNVALKLVRLREEQIRRLKDHEKIINSIEKCPITLENDQDLDNFPDNLEYIADLKHGDGVVVPSDPPTGCGCDKCSKDTECCAAMANSDFAYNANGRLRICQQSPIYECNKKCQCTQDCTNRVVQKGRKFELSIFKTKSCGWGVKALHKIPKNAFVCEYVGELIQDSVACVRDIEYTKRNISYLFDLDFNEDSDNLFCIDATDYGNVARFINHSCDPNLIVYPVWIDCLDLNLPRLAFFSKREILKNEEITFDYENVNDPQLENSINEEEGRSRIRTISTVKCQCNAQNCREWVFGNK